MTAATYTYKSYAPDGTVIEKDVVKVTGQTRKVLGITCRVVRDTVMDEDGNVTEDTTDWYAQDRDGNVWYFGEIAQNFDEEGILDNIDGSWTAGVEGAKPGIIMYANPQRGKTYRQEFLLGEAEDVGKVVGLDTLPALPAGARFPDGVHGPYLHIQDFSALEPGVVEDKYYAPRVGLVLVVAEDGTKEVLIRIARP